MRGGVPGTGVLVFCPAPRTLIELSRLDMVGGDVPHAAGSGGQPNRAGGSTARADTRSRRLRHTRRAMTAVLRGINRRRTP